MWWKHKFSNFVLILGWQKYWKTSKQALNSMISLSYNKLEIITHTNFSKFASIKTFLLCKASILFNTSLKYCIFLCNLNLFVNTYPILWAQNIFMEKWLKTICEFITKAILLSSYHNNYHNHHHWNSIKKYWLKSTCIGKLFCSVISQMILEDTAVVAYHWLFLIFTAGPCVHTNNSSIISLEGDALIKDWQSKEEIKLSTQCKVDLPCVKLVYGFHHVYP